jgi:hypothetical protein
VPFARVVGIGPGAGLGQDVFQGKGAQARGF